MKPIKGIRFGPNMVGNLPGERSHSEAVRRIRRAVQASKEAKAGADKKVAEILFKAKRRKQ